MCKLPKPTLSEFLEQFILPGRLEKIRSVLAQRTRHLTVVLEDIFQPQNASAALRTCECFGIQDVHIIENENSFEINPDVVMGASKWLSLYQYNQQEHNTLQCLESLRSKGYRLIATSPIAGAQPLQQLDISQKTALIFGNELKGLSDQARQLAHGFIHIPMTGFTESFNISVSVAICLHHLSNRLRNSEINWQLSPEDHQQLLTNWLKLSLRNPDALVNYFMKKESIA